MTELDLSPGRYELRIEPATRHDCRQCPEAPDHLADSLDGSGAVFIDGELVAVTDEYATAYLAAGSNRTPTKEQVETFVAAAMEFYAEALP